MKTLNKMLASAALLLLAISSKAQLSAPMDFPLAPNTSAANISAAEYYFDTDPGFGNGTNIPVTAGSNIPVSNFTVAINALTTGVHRLYVRVKNTDGVWSLTNNANFFIIPQGVLFPSNTNAADISAVEYYFDTDPGFGNGNNIPVTAGSDVSVNNIAVNISSLATGVHRLYARVKNTNGSWSITNAATFYIVQTAVLFPANASGANVSAAEYFLDNDPGFGNGTNIPITTGADVSANDLAVNISGLVAGVHRIYLRTQNTNGVWSITNVATFYIVPVSFSIPPNAAVGNITALEYFFDSDPGFGNGTMIAIPPAADLSNYTITADISGLQQDITHTLYVRALDGWSQTTTTTFTIGSPLPVRWISFTGKLQPDNSVLLEWQAAKGNDGSYFQVERSADGKSFVPVARINVFRDNDSSPGYRYIDIHPLRGNNYYRIGQTGTDGKTVYSTVILINTAIIAANDFYVINNPVHSVLRVHTGTHNANAQLQIIDMNGRALMQAPVANNDIQQIDLSQMAAGAYIIRCISGGRVVSKKFIKE